MSVGTGVAVGDRVGVGSPGVGVATDVGSTVRGPQAPSIKTAKSKASTMKAVCPG